MMPLRSSTPNGVVLPVVVLLVVQLTGSGGAGGAATTHTRAHADAPRSVRSPAALIWPTPWKATLQGDPVPLDLAVFNISTTSASAIVRAACSRYRDACAAGAVTRVHEQPQCNSRHGAASRSTHLLPLHAASVAVSSPLPRLESRAVHVPPICGTRALCSSVTCPPGCDWVRRSRGGLACLPVPVSALRPG